MGFWGNKLYDNDTASDLKEDFADVIEREETAEGITRRMLELNRELIEDIDEAPIFWMVLADLEWKSGLLDSEVKEKALGYIDAYDTDSAEGLAYEGYAESVFSDLKEKLLSDPPAPKKRKNKRLYHCEWALGDTFAYPIRSDEAKEYELDGEYLVFVKIDEKPWHPGHTIPIVWVKLTRGGKLPESIGELDSLEYIQTGFSFYEDRFNHPYGSFPSAEQILEIMKTNYPRDEYGHLPSYRISLINTSKRVIPRDLIFLGNYKDLTPPKNEYVLPKISVQAYKWREIVDGMLRYYDWFNLKHANAYKNPIKPEDMISPEESMKKYVRSRLEEIQKMREYMEEIKSRKA